MHHPTYISDPGQGLRDCLQKNYELSGILLSRKEANALVLCGRL